MKGLSFALLLSASVAFVLGGCSDASAPSVPPSDAVASSATFVPDRAKGAVSGQLIAFASDRETGFINIYLMKSNGDKVTRLTGGNPPEYYGRPDWSPDGTQMTLTTVLQYADGWQAQIYTMNADGSNKKRLSTPGNSEASRWSPDGTKIAFGMYHDDTYQVYVMNTDGSNRIRVTNDAVAAHDVTWAPDSRRVAYASWSDGQVHVINLDGTDDMRLTNDPVRAGSPAWSLRGDAILFVSYKDKDPEVWDLAEICLINADGTGLKRLTDNSYSCGNIEPRWSTDFSRIAFISNRDGNFELYTMNANGSGQTRVTNNPSSDWDPAWTVGNVQFE